MEKHKQNYTIIDNISAMHGQRLDKALSMDAQIGTRSRAENLIESDRVLVNRKKVKASHKVNAQDIIEVSFPENKSLSLSKLDLKLDIVFEDEFLIVINKPPGLVVHPAAGHEDDTLVNALVAHSDDFLMKFKDQRPGIVHRLDKDTSGLLVIAKNDLVLEALAQQFKLRSVHRIYQAITVGKISKQKNRICSFIARHPSERKKYSSILGSDKKPIRDIKAATTFGKWAVTNYEVIAEHTCGLNIVQLKLETGRTHQIRVHMSELGSPIISDPIYGSPKKEKAVQGKLARELLSHSQRCALHAAELGFEHPLSKKNLSFRVDWPDHQKLLKYLSGN